MPSPTLAELHAAHDGPVPQHLLDAERASRPIPTRLTGEALELRDTEASANMAEMFAQDCIREMRRTFRFKDGAWRQATIDRLRKDFRHHMLNCIGYRKIAASMRRRQARRAA